MAVKLKQRKASPEKNNLKAVIPSNKAVPAYKSGKVVRISVSEIDYSPFNDREHSEDELHRFARELGRNGVQVPIMVRPMKERYELVYGERRTRASRMAGLEDIPAIIRKDLSDDEVMFIQLLENFDRQDPHPMEIANCLSQLRCRGHSEREIAARLGRSKSFVISRLKLMLLNEEWRHIYRLNKVTTFDAFEVASLSPESQKELFGTLCKNWKDKDFKLRNLDYYIRRLKYELKNAPFDIKDKNILPEAGACTGCIHNSASFRTLFPDYSKDGFCSKAECFQTKYTRYLHNQATKILQEEQPQALIFYGIPGELLTQTIQQIDGASQLQQFNINAITILEVPEAPNKEEYMDDGDDMSFDEEGYKQAVEEYNEEQEEYDKQKERAQKGVVVAETGTKVVWFLPEKKLDTTCASKGTIKEIQIAIKSGTATTGLLEAGIERIRASIKQIQAAVRQNVQDETHKQFEAKVVEEGIHCVPTDADKAMMRFLLYQSMDFNTRGKVNGVLFSQFSDDDYEDIEKLYQCFLTMNSDTECFMVRTLSASKSESKYPSSKLAYFLNHTAQSAGIDTGAIEQVEQEKGNARKEKKVQKMENLQQTIDKLKVKEEGAKTAA